MSPSPIPPMNRRAIVIRRLRGFWVKASSLAIRLLKRTWQPRQLRSSLYRAFHLWGNTTGSAMSGRKLLAFRPATLVLHGHF